MDTTITREEFINSINKLRKTSKNKWYYYSANVNGVDVEIKGYNTWLQIFRVGGLDMSNGMDQKVDMFIEHLTTVFIINLTNLTLDELYDKEYKRVKEIIPNSADILRANALGIYSIDAEHFEDRYRFLVVNLVLELIKIK